VIWGSPTDPASWLKESFEVVYDNNGKDMDSCKPLIDAHMVGTARSWFAQSLCVTSV